MATINSKNVPNWGNEKLEAHFIKKFEAHFIGLCDFSGNPIPLPVSVGMDTPAQAAAVQFDEMTKRGYKVNLVTGRYYLP